MTGHGVDPDSQPPKLPCPHSMDPDLHLGTPGCQAVPLLDFLRDLDRETLYLVGDIMTAGSCAAPGTGRKRTTTSSRRCCAEARKGTRVVFVPGNHDEFARKYVATTLAASGRDGRVPARHRRRQTALDHHGDLFDGVVQHARWLATG